MLFFSLLYLEANSYRVVLFIAKRQGMLVMALILINQAVLFIRAQESSNKLLLFYSTVVSLVSCYYLGASGWLFNSVAYIFIHVDILWTNESVA